MSSKADPSFRPALIIVDFQEDFCPPNGSLAVTGGRDIAPEVNKLMELPFTLKIATQDWHPKDHVSFAANHPAPNNKPFESFATVKNPVNDSESETVRLWPVHCVQNTPGAEFLPEFNTAKLDHIVQKGQDKRVEMYSAFRDTYKSPCAQSSLAQILKEASITHVYVGGIAEDVCVKFTALHAAAEGYETYIIAEATKGVVQEAAALKKIREDMEAQSVRLRFKSINGAEIQRVAGLA